MLYLVVFFLGVIMGFYLGNKKLRRNWGKFIKSFKRDDMYDYDDDD